MSNKNVTSTQSESTGKLGQDGERNSLLVLVLGTQRYVAFRPGDDRNGTRDLR